MKTIRFSITLGILVCGYSGLSVVARSQTPDTASQSVSIEHMKISLDVESASLYDALKLVFTQVKCNFTLDQSLKGLTVTAHLTDVPFKIGLETLLKSTSTPLTYRVESAVYSVVRKQDEPAIVLDPVTTRARVNGSAVKTVQLIRVYNVSDLDIVQAFGGTIINIGLIPGFGVSGAAAGRAQNQTTNPLLSGGQNMFGNGHGSVIVTSPGNPGP